MRFFAFLLFILPQILFAQTDVQIRSGEHADFTRLVLTLDADSEWELTESRGAIVVSFPNQNLTFNTSNVFSRIPKTRVTAVTGQQDDSKAMLNISVPCRCAAKVFPFGSRHIVIDINDGGPLPEIVQAAESPPAFEFWQPNQLTPAPIATTSDFFAPKNHGQLSDGEEIVAETPQRKPVIENDINFELPVRDPVAPDTEMVARVEAAQDQLLQQLTRAADQGLIDFVPPIAPVVADEPVEEEMAINTPEPVIDDDSTLLHQLAARTAYDVVGENDLKAIINAFAKPQCMFSHDFSMVDWQTTDRFSMQLADLRGRIYGEFDRIDPAAAIGLAKLYTVNGLGAEAEKTLHLLDEPADEVPLLLDLAQLVDGHGWLEGGPISLGKNCGGDHEMWFLVGQPKVAHVIDSQSITMAFSTYPIGIRQIIGPRLADVLLNASEPDAAHSVLEIVRRAAVPESARMQLTTANILDSTERQAEAAVLLNQVAKSGGDDAIQAQLTLAKAAIRSDQGIAGSLLTDIEAVAFSQRGTAIGIEARELEIQMVARIDGMPLAMAMINTDLENTVQNWPRHLEIATQIMATSDAQSQGALAYAETVLQNQHLLGQDTGADIARIHVADQLLSIGLPNIAMGILNPALARQNPDALLVAATAYLAQFQPDEALQIVGDLNSPEAVELKLNAYLQKGDHAAISAVLSDPSNADFIENQLVWRAGDWQNIKGDNETMAAFMMGQELAMDSENEPSAASGFLTDLGIDEEPNLQTARNLLNANRASRAFIEDALAE